MDRKAWLWLLACAVLIVAIPTQHVHAAETAMPAQPAPSETPTPPPLSPPAPHPQSTVTPAPSGQWVNTSQYGWLWMPYDQRYTYVDEGAAAAQMFVYTAPLGWHWVDAPWVIGVGPVPFWGAFGPARFAWYAHPWFHVGALHAGWRAPVGRWHAVHGRR